jgi:Calcineurin-like phosphoesterase
MRKHILLLLLLVLASTLVHGAEPAEIQFVFTSDVHFGITRPAFRGRKDVDARDVNTALVAQINRLPENAFPKDGGRRAGQPVGPLDFMAIGGDITNRQEMADGIQSSAISWSQFRSVYIDGLKLQNRTGGKTPLYVVPGNHDVSNAIGYTKPLRPAIDKTSMTEIFNLMMRPAVPKVPAAFEYPRDKILVSYDIGGVHFVFITLWPDSSVRSWMENDLKSVSPNTPVIIFTHDPPDSDSQHFINPNGKHDMNAVDEFQNLLSDMFVDAAHTAPGNNPPPLIEQRAWEAFLRRHPNITAYFHGHDNFNQFYDWTGPDHTVALHTFRADSPMKGVLSKPNERRLSFQIATIDLSSQTMTVREVLWNGNPQAPNAPLTWGASTTVALSPR